MSADSGPDSDKGRPGVLDYLKPIALVVIIGVSGCFVWAVHSGDVFLIGIAAIVGGSLGLFAGLLAGVTLPETMMTIGAFTGLFEGIVRGFATYGVVGAIVGGPLGLLAGVIASIPLMMLLLLVQAVVARRAGGDGLHA